MKDRALFLDRDGTLVQPRHYPSRPEDLVLFDGIGQQLRSLQQAGFRLVVITNQSGIARGYFTEGDLGRMHDHLAAELARFGVHLDGVYHCPHHPDGAIPELAVRCACRKPEPGLLLRAAADLDLDRARSWFVGDILDDVEAGNRAGCRTILVDLGTEPAPQRPVRRPTFVARSTSHALQIVRAMEHLGRMPNLAHRPARWQDPAGAQPSPVYFAASVDRYEPAADS
jgi:D-glycero-D-manno-heptose 1,7-bisphosphate phosphatase